jgi:hypothetical protein
MRFQTPQFIDIEDKIFGPFTFKQFIYLAGGAGVAYVLYKILPLGVAILIIIPVLILAALLTFYKVNNKPFMFTLTAWAGYVMQNKLYLWKARKKKPQKSKEAKKVEKAIQNNNELPRLTESKLSDLSWSLDVLDMDQQDK